MPSEHDRLRVLERLPAHLCKAPALLPPGDRGSAAEGSFREGLQGVIAAEASERPLLPVEPVGQLAGGVMVYTG